MNYDLNYEGIYHSTLPGEKTVDRFREYYFYEIIRPDIDFEMVP